MRAINMSNDLFYTTSSGFFKEKRSIVRVNDFVLNKNEIPCHISIMLYDKSIIEYYNQNNSSLKDYQGIEYPTYLFIDIDNKDINVSFNSLLRVIQILHEKFNIEYNNFVVSFSGSKGFHIAIPFEVFSEKYYGRVDMHMMMKRLVAMIVGAKIIKQDIFAYSDIDFQIYRRNGMIRMPLSKHNKSGLYKVFVDYNLIYEKRLDEIINRANICDSTVTYQLDAKPNKLLCDLFEKCFEPIVPESYNNSTLSAGKTLFQIPTESMRNDSLYKMTFRLSTSSSLSLDEIYDIMNIVRFATNEVNKNSLPINEHELKTLFNSATESSRRIKESTKSTGLLGLLKNNLSFFGKDVAYKSSLFPNVDKEKFIFPGKLTILGGKGGSKKSLIAQQILLTNSKSKKCIFFNMEMSESTLLERLLLSIYGIDLKNQILTEEQIKVIEGYTSEIETLYPNLRIFNESLLTIQQIETAIIREKGNDKDALVIIDSMGKIHSHGKDETSSLILISNELARLAVRLNVAIVAIHHTTKECNPSVIDCTPYLRGGPKIIDNADNSFSISKIVDEDNSSGGIVRYKENLLYVYAHNKRGSGNVYEGVFELTPTLQITPTSEKYIFREQENKKQWI